MKIALVYCPSIEHLQAIGGKDLTLPPLGICSLSAWLKANGYHADLYDLWLELDTTVISEDFQGPLLRLFEAARSEKVYDLATMSDFGFYLGQNRNYLYREAMRLRDEVVNRRERLKGPLRDPVRDFFVSRAEKLAGYDIVGLSVIFDSQEIPAMILSTLIKRLSPQTKIVVGGKGAKASKWEESADLVVRGDGEGGMLSYVISQDESRRQEIVSHSDSRADNDRYFGRLDDLPTPDYEALFSKYEYMAPVRIIPLAITRGCYWSKCLFCSFGWVDVEGERCTAPYRKMSMERIIDDILHHIETNQTKYFFFSVDIVDPQLLEKIADQLIERSIEVFWSTDARVEEYFLKPGLLEKLYQSGCRRFSCGFESFNQKIADSMQKGINVELSKRLLEGLCQAGILTNIDCFIGFPGETPEEAVETHTVVNAFYERIPGHAAGKFQMLENSKVVRLGYDGELDTLYYLEEEDRWVKKGMSWSVQDRQWMICAANFYCDPRSSCFPIRSDGGYVLLYGARYPLIELANMVRNDDGSFGLFGMGRLTFYGFFFTHYYCFELFPRFDNERFIRSLRLLPRRGAGHSCDVPTKTERLKFAYETIGAFIDAHDLPQAEREFMHEVARFDYGLLISCLTENGLPVVQVDENGEFSTKDGSESDLGFECDFTVDVESLAECKPYAQIKKGLSCRVDFDVNGFHVVDKQSEA